MAHIKHEVIEREGVSHVVCLRQQSTPDFVKRYDNVALKCKVRWCKAEFTTDFDDIQRSLACPKCGGEVLIPDEYWGIH